MLVGLAGGMEIRVRKLQSFEMEICERWWFVVGENHLPLAFLLQAMGEGLGLGLGLGIGFGVWGWVWGLGLGLGFGVSCWGGVEKECVKVLGK